MQGIETVHHCTFWGGGGASADMNELRLTAEWHAMAALSCFAQRNALPRWSEQSWPADPSIHHRGLRQIHQQPAPAVARFQPAIGPECTASNISLVLNANLYLSRDWTVIDFSSFGLR